MTGDKNGDDVEPDVLIVDGRATMNQDDSSGDGRLILYANAAPFLELRNEHNTVYVPYLRMRFTVTPDAEQCFRNPLYSPELKQYFIRQWWGYVFLWGNINRRIAERTRRTTATIEVQHKILKTFDITQRNLEKKY